MLLEWTDPPFAPGHWVPEMIEAAGGVPLLGRAGAKSERVTWEAVHEAAPEVVVVAPCGYDRTGSQALADELVASGVLPAGCPVHAVDANAAWARPGTRLVDGVEELESVLYAVNRIENPHLNAASIGEIRNEYARFLDVFHCQERDFVPTILLWGFPPSRRVGQRMQ